MPARDALQCPQCSRATHHPVDALTGWCSACNTFTSTTAAQVLTAADQLERLHPGASIAGTVRWRLRRFGAVDQAGDPAAV